MCLWAGLELLTIHHLVSSQEEDIFTRETDSKDRGQRQNERTFRIKLPALLPLSLPALPPHFDLKQETGT